MIWLASYPRCGNTMVRLLLEHYADCLTLGVAGSATARGIFGDLPKLLRDSQEPYKKAVTRRTLVLRKTHSLEDRTPRGHRALVVIRDPRDALVSYAHYLSVVSDVPSDPADRLRELCAGTGWRDFYSHWATTPDRWKRTIIVRYEDIVADPMIPVRALRETMWGLRLKENAGPPMSFEQLHELVPTFFRVGKPGANRAELTPDLLAQVMETNGGLMSRFGYT